MVTDHSSVGFEFLTLDRPLIVFDAPDLPSAARINPQKVRLLRSAAVVVGDVPGLRAAAVAAVADPSHLTAERRHVVSQVFHDPGRATARALAMLDELLNRTGETPQAALPHATAARPRC
jgi:CDP-glycerol glycerophosphotransferase (TagB/SpsB family)